MRFAFSTTGCREWDFQTIAVRAVEMKYQGVELHGSFGGTESSADNLFLTDPSKLGRMFAEQGVEIACVGSPSRMRGEKEADARAADECRRSIDVAAQLGCQVVKISDGEITARISRTTAGVALGDWLMPLGDYAARDGVNLVLENAGGARSSREMWAILDRISHPAIGCCWNILNATLVGESPFVSVPTLGSRIQYAVVSDAKIGAVVEPCALGEGDVPVEKFITRLRGIGYLGWVTFSGHAEILGNAVAKLQAWTQPQHKSAAHTAKH